MVFSFIVQNILPNNKQYNCKGNFIIYIGILTYFDPSDKDGAR